MSNLTEEQLKQQNTALIVQWGNTHFRNRLCPICGATNWFHILDVFELRKYTGGGMVIGSSVPVILVCPVICQVCGYTFFLNSAKTGLANTRTINVNQIHISSPSQDQEGELPKNIADKYK